MNPETSRLLSNTITAGTVLAVDAAQHKMRLEIGENQTDWIDIPTAAAGTLSIWRCPTIGEQFDVMSASGDFSNARAVSARFSDSNPSPSSDPNVLYISFSAGNFLSINHETGTATFKLNKLTFDIPEVEFTGKVTAVGLIKSLTDVFAKTISLLNHKTTGVKAGTETAGVPQ